MIGMPLRLKLDDNAARRRLVNHGFFTAVQSAPLRCEQVQVFLGQWWHPLHYFPTFLAHCTAVLPDIAAKCAVAKILFQETGCGDPRLAHEVVFVETMERVGFSRAATTGTAPFPETEALVDGYRAAGCDRSAAIGSAFATEVADLAMVSAIGTAVRRVTGAKRLEWVDIHVTQEPDHVEQAGLSLPDNSTSAERDAVAAAAEAMWRLWSGFFDRLEAELFFQNGGSDERHARCVQDVIPQAPASVIRRTETLKAASERASGSE